MNIERVIGPIAGGGILGVSLGSLLAPHITVLNHNMVTWGLSILLMVLALALEIRIQRKEKSK